MNKNWPDFSDKFNQGQIDVLGFYVVSIHIYGIFVPSFLSKCVHKFRITICSKIHLNLIKLTSSPWRHGLVAYIVSE
jgi:hypothetical protein